MTTAEIEKRVRSVPGLTGVVSGGGPPSQGISKLKARRKRLEDERSRLFYKYVEVLGWIEELARDMWHKDLINPHGGNRSWR